MADLNFKTPNLKNVLLPVAVVAGVVVVYLIRFRSNTKNDDVPQTIRTGSGIVTGGYSIADTKPATPTNTPTTTRNLTPSNPVINQPSQNPIITENQNNFYSSPKIVGVVNIPSGAMGVIDNPAQVIQPTPLSLEVEKLSPNTYRVVAPYGSTPEEVERIRRATYENVKSGVYN